MPILLVLIFLLVGGWLIFKFVLPKLAKSEKVTLNYWGLWESKAVMAGVLAEWEKANPNIKVNYSLQTPKEYRERLQSALARGEGPDIFRFHLTWLPMFKNELSPLPASVMSNSQFEATFYPAVAANLRSGGNYYG